MFICDSPDSVRKAFASLEGTKNVLGLTNYQVLLQEYLKGDEYVVDTVSRLGVHKCVAIWKYDKRMFNGSAVVYFGMRLMPIDSEPQLVATVEYIFGVLDALGIRNGAIHNEVKIEDRGPGASSAAHRALSPACMPLVHRVRHVLHSSDRGQLPAARRRGHMGAYGRSVPRLLGCLGDARQLHGPSCFCRDPFGAYRFPSPRQGAQGACKDASDGAPVASQVVIDVLSRASVCAYTDSLGCCGDCGGDRRGSDEGDPVAEQLSVRNGWRGSGQAYREDD